ncbi:MAG: transpeptidase family protein [Deltaproteobacteria bacterium]|nr:transpeptidase family protein [Deltaproteobacteria bacterium]
MRAFHRTRERRRGVFLLKIFFLSFTIAIIARAVWLQTMPDPRLERLARRQFQSKVIALPRRGEILDRNGEGLAISLRARSLFLHPDLLKKEAPPREVERVLRAISRVLHIPKAELHAKMKSGKAFTWIKRQLTETEEQGLREHGALDYDNALGLIEETRRSYPNRELAAHVLGSVNIDGQGLEGLELQYESILAGEQSRISSTKDAMGRRIFEDGRGILAMRDGQSVLLTIDKSIQYETEKSIRKAVDDFGAKAGTAIVANASTGEILALANDPAFNPNQPKAATPGHRRNRAITDTFEPGSTFKPLLAGIALEKGRSPGSRIYCEKGSFKVGGRRISEAEAHEKFEWLTLGEILKLSSNVGAAKLALELGASTMGQLFERFGLGTRTGIDLPGEVAGSASREGLRSPVRLANVGFGHGVTVTPIQMLTYYLAIANGGRWVQPKLVKAIVSESEDSLEKGEMRWKLNARNEPKARAVLAPATARAVSRMLEAVTQEGGTGVKAQLEEWPVAGKTGTAQKIDPETRRYSRTRHIASFAGFAPAQSPRIVAFVMLDEPKHPYYASETAAPAFREVMRAALLREKVPPITGFSKIAELANKNMIESIESENRRQVRALLELAPQPAAESIAGSSDVTAASENPAGSGRRVPDLHGLTVREALRALRAENETPSLDVEIIGSGILKAQEPAAHERVESSTKIRLFFEAP